MSEQEKRPATNNGQPNGQGGGKHRHRHHRGHGKHGHKPQQNQNAAQQNNTASATPAQPKPQAQQAQGNAPAKNNAHPAENGGHNRHRNRHRHKRGGHQNQNQNQNQQQAQDAAPVAETPVAEAPAPIVTPTPSFATTPVHTEAPFAESAAPVCEISAETLALTEDVPIIGGRAIPPEAAVTVVGIRFREHGKIYYFAPGDLDLSKDIHVIVDTANGDSYGFVATIPHQVDQKELTAPLRSVLRIASEEEKKIHKQNRRTEVDAYNTCVEKIARLGLPMKLIDVECPFDRSKLLFFFTTPEERVDFRELVKELAGVFHIRIEMRQIGIRDEARKLGGLGICGRPFCCSSFLTNFAQVTIKMAKEQNLALNAAKISGACGRLMCCLRYEHEVYEAEIKLTPKVDSIVATPDGNALVVESAPLQGLVKVRFLANPEAPPKQYVREDVRVIGSKKKGITEQTEE